MKHDPIEDIPLMRPILEAAEKEADAQLINHPYRGGLGFGHVFYETKKRILKEKYSVDWRTPQEMNPGVTLD